MHQLGHPRLLVVGKQVGQGQHADVTVVTVGDEQLVGMFRDLAAHAQVAQHHVEGDIGADGDRIEIHQAAGGVLGIGQQLLELLALLAIEDVEHADQFLRRQHHQQVGLIVGLRQAVDDVGDLARFEVTEDLLAHIVMGFEQHLAQFVLVDLGPDLLAVGRRCGFEQVGNLRRVGLVEQVGDGAVVVLFQRFRDVLSEVFGVLIRHEVSLAARKSRQV